MYQRRQYSNRYNSSYKPQQRQLYQAPQYRKRFTQMDKVRKLAGTQPETTVEKIAKGVGTVATIAKTVAGIVSVINTEDKYIDTNILADVTNVPSGTGSYTQTLNLVAQGNTRDQRNGNKILCKSIQLQLQIKMNDSTTALSSNLRLVLLYDKKPQISTAAGPLFAEIYVPTLTTGFIDKDNVGDRYVILRDWKISLNNQDKRLVWEEFYKQLDRIHCQFTGPSASAFETGRIFLTAISDSSPVGININGQARFCYTDN